MDYEAIFDAEIAPSYDEDEFGILAVAHKVALDEIERHLPAWPIATICDVAVGTARFLELARSRFPDAELAGMDISGRMLELASERLPQLKTFHADATKASRHMAPASIDLSIAQFVMSCLSPHELLRELRLITRPGGLCSVANNTRQSLSTMQQLALRFVSKDHLESLYGTMPLDEPDMCRVMRDAGFKVLGSTSLRAPLHFNSFEELHTWGTRSGFLNTAFNSISPELTETMRHASGIFPLDDQVVCSFVLARA